MINRHRTLQCSNDLSGSHSNHPPIGSTICAIEASRQQRIMRNRIRLSVPTWPPMLLHWLRILRLISSSNWRPPPPFRSTLPCIAHARRLCLRLANRKRKRLSLEGHRQTPSRSDQKLRRRRHFRAIGVSRVRYRRHRPRCNGSPPVRRLGPFCSGRRA